ncbi:hypothetical protein ES703_100350 [subsurface metagenome]
MAKKNPDELNRMWHGGELTIVGDALAPGVWGEDILEQVIDFGDRRVLIHQIDLDVSCYPLLTPEGYPDVADALELDWEFSTQARMGQVYRMIEVGRHKINSGCFYRREVTLDGRTYLESTRQSPDLYIIRKKIDFGGEGKVLDLDYDEFIYALCNHKLDSGAPINWFYTWRTVSWFEQVGEWGRR